MNWPFRSLSRLSDSERCESIEPLLSLYADGMTSPDETRRVEAHLPGCGDCREALSWMQATHRALAARPIVTPPADLHSRIAQAIAASSSAPLSLRPARSFILRRSSYAAAASLTVLGLVLSYSLRQVPDQTVKLAPKSTPVASVPAHSGSGTPAARLPRPARSARPLVASNTPPVVKTMVPRHLPVLIRTAPITPPILQDHARIQDQARNSPEHLMARVPGAALHPVPLSATPSVKAPVHALPPHNLIAKSDAASPETRLPAVPKVSLSPKISEPLKIAKRIETPDTVPVTILPATVTQQPPVQAASDTASGQSKLGDILGTVRAGVVKMRTVSYQTPHQSYRGAANVMRSLDKENFAYVDAIHTP